MRITQKGYNVLAAHDIEFDFAKNDAAVVSASNDKIDRLTEALKAIGRLHLGKTKDSHRVRAIIRKVLP